MIRFITFEGPEGGGKSTQLRRLRDELTARGYAVVTTREPGGTAIGEGIRQILLSSQHCDMLPETEALLNSAARAQHVAEVIRPALAAGKLVLCDRYADSTLAYQGAGRGLDERALLEMQRVATGGLWPDLTLLLDVPVEVGRARRLASGEPLNRIDADEAAFHERVRAWFLRAAERDPLRWRRIDASAEPDAVAHEILLAVLHALDEPRRCGRGRGAR